MKLCLAGEYQEWAGNKKSKALNSGSHRFAGDQRNDLHR